MCFLHIAYSWSIFKICFVSICLLIEVFCPFTFNVSPFTKMGFNAWYLTICFLCDLCLFFSLPLFLHHFLCQIFSRLFTLFLWLHFLFLQRLKVCHGRDIRVFQFFLGHGHSPIYACDLPDFQELIKAIQSALWTSHFPVFLFKCFCSCVLQLTSPLQAAKMLKHCHCFWQMP